MNGKDIDRSKGYSFSSLWEVLEKIIKYESYEILPSGAKQKCLCSHTQHTICNYRNRCVRKSKIFFVFFFMLRYLFLL
jgi:hypothetical protein